MINIDYTVVSIKDIIIHQIGNKLRDENLLFSKEHTTFSLEKVQYSLLEYFLSHFKSDEQYRFFHDIDLQHNETFIYVSRIFENPNDLIEQSKNLAIHLYNQSTHPKIKRGEFYIVYFKNCILDGETLDAIGLFKSENKDTFLEIEQVANGFAIDSRKGININKLDKGCLIFNTVMEDGARVLSVDANSYDTEYWLTYFLNVDYIRDNNFETRSYLEMCRAFSEEVIKEKESKKEQIDFLNQSIAYFDENDMLLQHDFRQTVFEDEGLKTEFANFKTDYEKDNGLEFSETFDISPIALKKQKQAIKNYIKLDTNIQIKLDFRNPESSKQFLEKGFDEEKGMYYYKVYFNEEL